jgi:hypothetical protein
MIDEMIDEEVAVLVYNYISPPKHYLYHLGKYTPILYLYFPLPFDH